ncbi:hypothetical protein P9112_006083 [Eukaryota sp. TZLM1-RC]
MSFVALDITHNILPQRFAEVRFELSLTIGDLKQRLHKHTGTQPEWMKIKLLDIDGTFLCDLDDDDLQLGFFNVSNDMGLHVIDSNPLSSTLDVTEDLSKVEKFELTEEEYDQRKDTFRNWRKKNPDVKIFSSCPCVKPDYAALASNIKIGDRCEVLMGAKRGTIRYIGDVNGSGVYVGIELDEPLGKNNGSVGGVEYFQCEHKFGVFVRPDKIKVGDFPVIDELELDSD